MAKEKAKAKETTRKKTEFMLACDCGAKARVYETAGDKFYARCPGCGKVTFGSNTDLLERLKYGGSLCPHHPAVVPCKRGFTSWCPLCRIRTFSSEQPSES